MFAFEWQRSTYAGVSAVVVDFVAIVVCKVIKCYILVILGQVVIET